jgi:hypothetical protein
MPEKIKHMELTSALNVTRQVGMELATKYLDEKSPLYVMGELGANTKGDVMKNCQMMCTIGQQYISGERLEAKLSNGTRQLPSMDINDNDPVARGYIKESFYKGVNGAGLFFLHQAGREGLLNTAIQTAKYGEMHRRMVRGYCSVVLDNDYSLRMGKGRLLSPVFNMGSSLESNVNMSMGGKKITAPFDLHKMALDISGRCGWIKESAADHLETKVERREGDVTELLRESKPSLDLSEYPGMTLPAKVTSYERSSIVEHQAHQLECGFNLLFDEGTASNPTWDGIDPVATAMREWLNKFNSLVRRELPSGEVITVDPQDNVAVKYSYELEPWMEEVSRVKYNRPLPTIVLYGCYDSNIE